MTASTATLPIGHAHHMRLIAAVVPLAVSCFASLLAASTASADSLDFDTSRVESLGVGCRFVDGPQRQADAFLIANGNEITAIFTQLGSVFRSNRRTGDLQSGCRYRIPGTLEQGFFISGIEQTVTYGLVKSAGAGVRIVGTTNFARRLPNGRSNPADLIRNLAMAEVTFAPAAILNIALDTISPVPVRTRRGQSGDNAFNRFCGAQRPREIDSVAGLVISVDKQTPEAQVSVSIDGLDVRYSVGATLETCR